MLLKIQMSTFDPDAINFKYRTVWFSMDYDNNALTYSYLRYIAAAEAGLLPRIDNDPDYDFEVNYVKPIRYCLIF